MHEFRSSESESVQDFDGEVDQDNEPPRAAVGGKLYEKVHFYSITDRSCVLADRRMVSIRQQSDILKSSLGNEIAASPSTVHRQREKVRRALAESENLLKTASAIQLCYDGCMVD